MGVYSFLLFVSLLGLLNSRAWSAALISLDEQEEENIDYKCDFEDRKLAETVRFFRSPHSCRVYHICAFFKQYTLTCPPSLHFDEDLSACNLASSVNCNETTNTTVLTSESTLIHRDNTTSVTKVDISRTTAANIITNSPETAAYLLPLKNETSVESFPMNLTISSTKITTRLPALTNSSGQYTLVNSSSIHKDETVQNYTTTFSTMTTTQTTHISATSTEASTTTVDDHYKSELGLRICFSHIEKVLSHSNNKFEKNAMSKSHRI